VVGNLLVSYPTTLIYEFDFVGNPNVDISQDENDGGKFYNNNITFDLVGLSDAVEIQKLAKKDYIIIFEDENGNNRILGLKNGLALDSLTSNTGGAKSDLSGFNLSFKGQEEEEPYFINNLADAGFVLDDEPPIIIDNYTDLCYINESLFLSTLNISGIKTGMAISNNGFFILLVCANPDLIHKINLTIPFDLSSANYNNENFDITSFESSPQDIYISNDGLNILFSGQGSDNLRRLILPSNGDLVNGVIDSAFINYSALGTPNSFTISPDGLNIIMASSSVSRIQHHVLTAPFDLSTATLQTDLTNFNYGGQTRYIQFLKEGNILIVFGQQGVLNEFALPNPYTLIGIGSLTVPSFQNTLTELFSPRALNYYGDESEVFGLGRFQGTSPSNEAIIKYKICSLINNENITSENGENITQENENNIII